MTATSVVPTTQTAAGLQVKDMRAGYGRREVIHSVSFDLHPSKISVLLGANGAGKSTLAQAIVGAVKLSGGSVIGPDGQPIRREPALALRQGVALVPEGGRIFADFSVEENLRLGSFLAKDAAAVAEDRAFVLDLFPVLGDRLKQKGGTLSGGERQMLAIGRTLMSRPRVLLLDEPFLGIAPILAGRIATAITRICTERAIPTLLIEQNRRAIAIASEVLVLRLGEFVLRTSDTERLMGPQGTHELEALYLG